jgi:hypothetical protein
VLSAELPMTAVTKFQPYFFFQRHYVAPGAGTDAYWTKPELPSSANYRNGFGPLGLNIRLEPWYPSTFGDFGFAHDATAQKGKTELLLSGAELGASSGELPSVLAVTYKVPIAPFADFAANDASQFKGTLDTRTGVFKGSFVLVDGAVSRTVPIAGTLLMAEDLEGGTVTAEGFTLVKSLAGGAEQTVSGRVQFKNPTPPAP